MLLVSSMKVMGSVPVGRWTITFVQHEKGFMVYGRAGAMCTVLHLLQGGNTKKSCALRGASNSTRTVSVACVCAVKSTPTRHIAEEKPVNILHHMHSFRSHSHDNQQIIPLPTRQ